jgi:hypothetical protein
MPVLMSCFLPTLRTDISDIMLRESRNVFVEVDVEKAGLYIAASRIARLSFGI